MIEFVNSEQNLKYSISIEGYQFPDIKSDWDGNWLRIRSEVQYKDNVFTRVDPSLVTLEFADIVNWFDCISNSKIPKYINLSFAEPNLEFQLYGNVGNVIRYGIKLELELKPNFKIDLYGDDFVMVFEHSFDQLKEIRDKLKRECEAWPQRGVLY
jgi:hypothetical protein